VGCKIGDAEAHISAFYAEHAFCQDLSDWTQGAVLDSKVLSIQRRYSYSSADMYLQVARKLPALPPLAQLEARVRKRMVARRRHTRPPR